MRTLLRTTCLLLILSSLAHARRTALPKPVPPVSAGEVVFSAPHSPPEKGEQFGGFIEAHNTETKELLWRVRVYDIENGDEGPRYNFIMTLSYDKTHEVLVLADEHGRIYVLNPATRKVTEIE